MTRRELTELRNATSTLKKVEKANDFVFEYLRDGGFTLMETKMLISSMNTTISELTSRDSLRKISDFPDIHTKIQPI